VTDLSTWVEVDLDAFAHNLRLIRELVGPAVRLHLVVKADAYGHGVAPIARTAEQEGVHSLGVATLEEGIELRQEGVRLPVVILSPSLPFEAGRIVENRLAPTVGNLEIARVVSHESVQRGLVTEIQVEIDTGMGRTGVAPAEVVSFLSALSSLPGLKLAGTFTHFPKADQPAGAPMAERQLADFRLAIESVRVAGLDPGLLHAANSAAIVNHPTSYLDMVRPGALAYGITPAASVRAPENLKPVMRFASRLVHIRELGAGHPISYGGDFVTPERMRVGTAPVGYGHGFPFSLSGRGYALLRGRRVPILGRITMDTTVFDLRGVPEARLGDEIVLFGRQGDETIRVGDLAALAGTIPYELLCGIGRRVTRVYTKVGRRVGSRTLLGAEPAVPTRPKE
jgi:alanine racemase